MNNKFSFEQIKELFEITDSEFYYTICNDLLTLKFIKQWQFLGNDLNYRSKIENLSLLHIASLNEQIDLVEYLVNNNVIIDIVDFQNNTPLKYGIRNINIAKILLNNGANPNHKNDNGYSCFHYACSTHNLDLIKLMVQKDADVNLKSNKNETYLDLLNPNFNNYQEIVSYLTSL